MVFVCVWIGCSPARPPKSFHKFLLFLKDKNDDRLGQACQFVKRTMEKDRERKEGEEERPIVSKFEREFSRISVNRLDDFSKFLATSFF